MATPTVRAGAAPHLTGRRVRAVHLRREDLRWPMPAAALQDLVGRRCTALERRSKYILAHFDGPDAPVAMIHLGMTGRVIVEVIKPRASRPEYRKHEHWRMDFGDRLVRFVDPRRFGALDVTPGADLRAHPLIRDLGVEPLEPGFGYTAMMLLPLDFLIVICRTCANTLIAYTTSKVDAMG